MVYINDTALEDLNRILEGLMMWKKHPLNPEHAENYVDDIAEFCYTLDLLPFHFKATYQVHIQYGEYAYRYKRSNTTTWYIIYNIDEKGDIFINKIISNYMTVS